MAATTQNSTGFRFPKVTSYSKHDSLSSQATSTVAASGSGSIFDKKEIDLTPHGSRYHSHGAEHPDLISSRTFSGLPSSPKMHPYARSLGAELEDKRGRNSHVKLSAHFHTQSLSRSRSPSPGIHRQHGHHRSTSSLSVELDTAYHGPVIPPDSDRSAFAPPSLNRAQALTQAAKSRAAMRSGRRGYLGRTLVLCFDGTGNQFDLDNSNVVNFFSVLRKGDHTRQLVYYQSGIGTYTIPQVATPLYAKTSKLLDLMFANSINHHVMSGYKFLMQEYKSGDKICIFGFSRGAYTARALAGMIHKVGLLPAGNEQQVPFAYKMFSNDSEMGWRQSVAFKKTFSLDVDIDFVGVWDTVASVGIFPTTLPFTRSNTAIKVFRHALALDEHRVKFKPSPYQRICNEDHDFKVPEQSVIDRRAKLRVELKAAARLLTISREKGRERERGRPRSSTKVQGEVEVKTSASKPDSSKAGTESDKKIKNAQYSPLPVAAGKPGTAPPQATAADVHRSVSSLSAPASSTSASASISTIHPAPKIHEQNQDTSSDKSSGSSRPSPLRGLGLLRESVRHVSDDIKTGAARVSGELHELSRSRERITASLERHGQALGRELGMNDDDDEALSPDTEKDRLEAMYLDRSRPTDVKEVWFAGAHGDVGGGCVGNETPASLARIPLRWMIRECFRVNTGIQFEADKLRMLGLEPSCLWPNVLEPTTAVTSGDGKEGESMQTKTGSNESTSGPAAALTSTSGEKKKSNSLPASVSATPRSPSPLRTSLSLKEGEKSGTEAVTDSADALKAPKMEERRNANFSLDGTLVDGEGRETSVGMTVTASGVGSSEIVDAGAPQREERENVDVKASVDIESGTKAPLAEAEMNESPPPSALDVPIRVAVQSASTEALNEKNEPDDKCAEVTTEVKAETEGGHTSEGSTDEKHQPRSLNEKVTHLSPSPSPLPTPAPKADATSALPIPWPAPSRLEETANIKDARSSSNDQLNCAKWWWILEYLPMRERVQTPDGTWRKKWTLNRGRPRALPAACANGQQELHVHRSVLVRMHMKDVDPDGSDNKPATEKKGKNKKAKKQSPYQPRVRINSPGVKVVWVD